MPRGAMNRFLSRRGVFWRKWDGRNRKVRLGTDLQSRDPPKRLRARGPKPRYSARKKRDDGRPPGRAAPFARPSRPISATTRNFRPRCLSMWTLKGYDDRGDANLKKKLKRCHLKHRQRAPHRDGDRCRNPSLYCLQTRSTQEPLRGVSVK